MSKLPLFFFYVLLLIPKIDVFRLPSTSITSKPEDLVAGLMQTLLVLSFTISLIRINRRTQTGKLIRLCGAYIILISIITMIFGGNVFYIFRYILYFSMILVAFVPTKDTAASVIEKAALAVIIVYAVVSILQKTGMIGGIHTGQYVSDVSERTTLIFTNSTEAGLISGVLFGIVLGLKERPFAKIVAFVCATVINFLGQNRIALATLFLVALVYVLRKKEILLAFRRMRLRLSKRTVLVIFAIIILIAVGALSVYMPRAFVVTSEVSLREVIQLASVLVRNQIESDIVPSNISDYAIGRSSAEYDDLDESLILRLQKWTYVVNILLSGYVFGIGAGNSIGDAIDGFYFRVLVETGFAGLLVYVLIFYRISRITRLEAGGLAGLTFVLAILLLQGAFLDSFYFSRVGYLFWLLIGIKLRALGENHNPANYWVTTSLDGKLDELENA